MTRQEILNSILAHKPKGVLTDFCGCSLSAANDSVLDRLNDYLGFGRRQGYFDERMLTHYDIDTRAVGYIIMPPKPHYKVLEVGKTYSDEWGIIRQFDGEYWNIVSNPLRGLSAEEIAAYPFPDIDSMDYRTLDEHAELARRLYTETDKIVVSSHPVYGVFEIACWMFGFDDFLCRMALEPETVHAFFTRYFYRTIFVYIYIIVHFFHIRNSVF